MGPESKIGVARMSNLADEIQAIAAELQEHTGQILTAISMKSKTLTLRLNPGFPDEAQVAQDIEQMALDLMVAHQGLHQRLLELLSPEQMKPKPGSDGPYQPGRFVP